jgi:hypothetical protein
MHTSQDVAIHAASSMFVDYLWFSEINQHMKHFRHPGQLQKSYYPVSTHCHGKWESSSQINLLQGNESTWIRHQAPYGRLGVNKYAKYSTTVP